MRILIDRALEKASEAEKLGDTERAEKFLKIAEEAEKTYDKIDQNKLELEKRLAIW